MSIVCLFHLAQPAAATCEAFDTVDQDLQATSYLITLCRPERSGSDGGSGFVAAAALATHGGGERLLCKPSRQGRQQEQQPQQGQACRRKRR